MMADEYEQEMLVRVKAALERKAEMLDPDTCERLRVARNRALAEAGSGSGWRSAPLVDTWWRAGFGYALASLAVVVVAGWLWLSPARGPQEIGMLADLELLTAAEEPEFYAQLDFYLWLDDEAEG